MALKFHNTLTGRVDEFVSQENGKVSIYTCGPTVYNHLHIGNWLAYIYWDVLVRTLIANGYTVNRVMNITDVGHLVSDADEGQDKLEKSALKEGKSAWQIADFYTQDFLKSFKKLNLIEPQFFAKATDFIPQQLELIKILKQKGYTYQTNDGIYFDTSKFPKYADFAKLKLDSLLAGHRVDFNNEKRNLSDFALWKFSPNDKKRDMEWQTPVEILDNYNSNTLPIMGFPGWHLECSAIILSTLGQTIDIHTGGIDHIPVHHTNEIAQSESATGERFCNYWLHNNHLKSNGTKISKSLGNGYTLDQIEAKGYSIDDFKMFVLQTNYKNEGNFTFENLDSARNRYHNWKNIAVIRHQIHDTIENETNDSAKTFPSFAISRAIIETLSDDLDTPNTLKIIDEAFNQITNSRLERISRQSLVNLLNTIDDLLGFNLLNNTSDISDRAKQLIIERNNARSQKDWSKSDDIRSELSKLNITVRDTQYDTIWSYIN